MLLLRVLGSESLALYASDVYPGHRRLGVGWSTVAMHLHPSLVLTIRDSVFRQGIAYYLRTRLLGKGRCYI